MTTEPVTGAADVARALSESASHLTFVAIGFGAWALRLSSYVGAPRPWRIVLLDGCSQTLVGFGVAEATHWLTGGSVHASIALGLCSGLLGWEVVKRIAATRANKLEGGTPDQ